MKIAFCGDSFCADTKMGTWPYRISKKLNASLMWKGHHGANQYTILKQAKKLLLQKPDLIIFTHTEPYRLANRHDEPLGARPCSTNVHPKIQQHLSGQWKDKDKVWLAGHWYYEHLMDFGYHEIPHIGLLKECEKMCKESGIKALHLFSFSTKELGFRDYNWDVELENSYTKQSLAKISYMYQTPDNDDQSFNEPGWKTLPNHMNYQGNKHVYDLVIDLL